MIKFTKTRCVICAFLLMAVIFTGCANGNVTENGETKTTDISNEGETSSETSNEAGDMVILFGGEEDYTILRTDAVGEFGDVTQDFLSSLRKKIGKNDIFASGSYGSETAKEILLGSVSQRKESIEAMKNLPYGGYKILFMGEKLVISAHTPERLGKAINDLLGAMKKTEDGAWGIPKSFKVYMDNGDIEIKIPEFESQTAQSAGKYIMNDSQNQLAYTGITEADYTAYNKKLTDEGFTLYSQNEMGDNKFATYTDDITEVHLIWFKSIGNFRIVYSEKGWLPSVNEPQYDKIAESTVTQLARKGAANSSPDGAPGESYVIQLEDGSFVIIDGGPRNSGDSAALMSFLLENKPTEHAKPKVTWMFTHLHSDHTALAIDFLAANTYNIDLKTICYNFPDVETALQDANCKAAYESIRVLAQGYKNTNVFIFHSGQKLKLAGCEIEFLYTQEDHWPHAFETANDTSAVWRMTFESGHDFLVLGDSEKSPCTEIERIYGSYLKSDVLQPSHHGFNGATLEIYQAINPSICLWPVEEYRFNNDTRCLGTKSGYEFNAYLRNQGNRQHYHAGQTVTVKMSDLTVTVK